MSDFRKFIVTRVNGRVFRFETTHCSWCRENASCSVCARTAVEEANKAAQREAA